MRNADKVYDISISWQPNWRFNDAKWNLSKDYDPQDSLGWSYSYLESSNHTAAKIIHELIDVLPDDNPDMPHSVVKACRTPGYVSPYVMTAIPNWKVVGQKSIIYE